MWKERFKNRILNIFILQFCLIQFAFNQTGVNALMIKHSLHSLTARSSFQKMLIDHKGLMYIATSEGIIIYNGSNEQFVKSSEIAGNQKV